ncbi:hypothetical protein IB276_18420 [Ensifer sp. ENS04]|uniref:hypothetical protein n=1 Tax=Ensifer sp. ENS04 TaxID=2769281 RepID=UPI00178592C3|nr:hypothetical protein [Ensifer sp. ENS04]MBD9541432.1 hypothetical protein [Ensifer sp. ENS04]
MAKRMNPRKKKGGGSAVLLGVLALGASAVLAVVIALLSYKAITRPPLDTALCPKTGPVAVTALLLDTTDPITPTTLGDARNKFNDVVSHTTVGEFVGIYGLTDTPGELTAMFEGCNPGDGSTVDQWTSNPKLQQRKWEDAFGKPMEKISEQLPGGQGGRQSPIMAGIQSIKLQVFDRHKSRDIPKSLIVMSDMIEHTKLYSQYRSNLDFQTYRSSPAEADYRTSLKGVDVTIWYIDRGLEKFSGRSHINFWGEWVLHNEGTDMRSLRLEGVNPHVPAGGNS